MTLQNNLNEKIIIILCTVPYDEIAFLIAKKLIKNNLAACITLSNVRSMFIWDNEIKKQQEVQLLIKTHKKLEETIFKYIRKKHPYQTPELLTLEVLNGESNYLSWINRSIKIMQN